MMEYFLLVQFLKLNPSTLMGRRITTEVPAVTILLRTQYEELKNSCCFSFGIKVNQETTLNLVF